MRTSSERGIAMITVLLVMMLMSALLVGFTTVVMSDQRYRFIDRDRGQSFYGAAAGIEKLTADLGNLFFTNVAPTGAQVKALTDTLPVLKDANNNSLVTFSAENPPEALPASSLSAFTCTGTKTIASVGSNGYTIMFCKDPVTGRPTTVDPALPIKTGPYEGLIALQTPYQLDVTAKTPSGGETHLVRTIESVAIPVFQFGMFSDVDLSFSAADDFDFGGRVHTNGNLFLAEGKNSTLTLSDKVTAVKEIVRQRLSNGVTNDVVQQTGTIKMWTGSAWRNLLDTEGSVTDGLGSTANPDWQTVSLSYYNSRLRNAATGAKELKLPLTMVGGSNPDLVARPNAGEDTANSVLYGERLYSKASLRILISDRSTDITTLPGIDTTKPPISLAGNWNVTTQIPYAGYAVASTKPPVALSSGTISTATADNSGSTVAFPGNAAAQKVAAATFKPTFWLTGYATTQLTCTTRSGGSPWRLTGCSGPGATTVPAFAANMIATVVSPQGKATGIATSAGQITATTANSVTFNSQAAMNLIPIAPVPFWDDNSKLYTCTGFTDTSYTGCSSIPTDNATIRSQALSTAETPLIGGFIKIEKSDANGVFTDVTQEILSYGIGAPNLAPSDALCADPTPNAVIRLQRLRDNGDNEAAGVAGGGCNYNTDTTGAKDPTNWWPNVLFDTREGVLRDSDYPGDANLTLNGLIYYVALDVANLAKWFKSTAPLNAPGGSGTRTDNGGFTVYFSDRRNNHDSNNGNKETGEYGWEDFINAGNSNGMPPSTTLDAGENVNASKDASGHETLDVYGGKPNYYDGTSFLTAPPGASAPLNSSASPVTTVTKSQAMVNRPVLFRRGLKLINGGAIAPTITGLTIASENPVYIQGDYNVSPANDTTFGNVDATHAATSVIADAVTLLSRDWNDVTALTNPYDASKRPRPTDSYYRVAIVSGKSMIFNKPSDIASASSTFGTDGGAHSFLRMLEGGSDKKVHYRGSMATFYYARQAIGTFKCCGGVVYSVPTRDFFFDVDFLDPAKLPPNTPVFRDMNAVGFSQEMRPGK